MTLTSGAIMASRSATSADRLPVAAGQLTQRELGRSRRVAGAGRVRAQRGAHLDQMARDQTTKLLTQRFRGGDYQGVQAALDVGAVSNRAAAGHPQAAQRLDPHVSLFRHGGSPARQRGTGGGLGVDRVGLALPAAHSAVRAVDLHHRHVLGAQEPGQAGAVHAGALDTDQHQAAEPGQPRQ
jgi:hypothetical protein